MTKQNCWKKTSKILDFTQKVVFVIGIPISIYTYFYTHQKEREDHQFFIYDNMDERYWEYEVLVSKHPELGLSDATLSDTTLQTFLKPDSLWTNEEKIFAREMMFLLISMYERSFIMYSNEENDFRKRQWIGWSNSMKRWLTNRHFLNAWAHSAGDFDSDFEDYVNREIRKAGKNNFRAH